MSIELKSVIQSPSEEDNGSNVIDSRIASLLARLNTESFASIFGAVSASLLMDVVQMAQSSGALQMTAKRSQSDEVRNAIAHLKAEMSKEVTLDPNEVGNHCAIKIVIGVGLLLVGVACLPLLIAGGFMVAGGIYDVVRLNDLQNRAHNPYLSKEDREQAKHDLINYGTKKDKEGDSAKCWGFASGMPFYDYDKGHFVQESTDPMGATKYQQESGMQNNAASQINSDMSSLSQNQIQQASKILEELSNLFRTLTIQLFATYAKVTAN